MIEAESWLKNGTIDSGVIKIKIFRTDRGEIRNSESGE